MNDWYENLISKFGITKGKKKKKLVKYFDKGFGLLYHSQEKLKKIFLEGGKPIYYSYKDLNRALIDSYDPKVFFFFLSELFSGCTTCFLVTKDSLSEIWDHERKSFAEGHCWFPTKKLFSLWNVRFSLVWIILCVRPEFYLCIWINCFLYHLQQTRMQINSS